MKAFTVTMSKERETKGAVLYKTTSEHMGKFVEGIHDEPVFNMYIRKDFIGEDIPEHIQVDIQERE